jgi:mRNA-degrading endonuclease toxin of MazEF toxin-antitoxin module
MGMPPNPMRVTCNALFPNLIVCSILMTLPSYRKKDTLANDSGFEEGFKHDSVVNLDHVQTLGKSRLCRRIAEVDPEKMKGVCRALAIATGC